MCKMFMAAGRFSSLDIDERPKFHRFMEDLFRSTQYDSKDQDAAGFYSMIGDRHHHDRSGGDSRHLIRTSREWRLMEHNPCTMYLCHARGAMSSAVNPNNNHPFVGENVALMHEGWLELHKEEAKQRRLSLNTETDSEFYMRLADQRRPPLGDRNEWDPVACMNSMLKITTEPTALAFIDHSSKRPQLWFGKNGSEGNHPFYFYRIKRFKGMFLVSAEEMMTIAGALNFDDPGADIQRIPFDAEPFKTYQMDPLHNNITVYEP
jgi:hypothetical protein